MCTLVHQSRERLWITLCYTHPNMGADAILLLIKYKYFIIFPLTIVEGPIVMITSGFLLKLEYFYFWPLFFTLMAADLCGDIIWYCLGRYGGVRFVKRFGKYFSITEGIIEKVRHIFHGHKNKILFISKITTGFGFAPAVLFTAGFVRIPFKQYLIFNFLGQFVWTGALIFLGYSIGSAYLLSFGKGFEIAGLVAVIVIAVLLIYGMGKYFKGGFIKMD